MKKIFWWETNLDSSLVVKLFVFYSYLTSKRSNIGNFVSEIRVMLLSYLLNYLSSLIERMCRGFCSEKFCLYFIVWDPWFTCQSSIPEPLLECEVYCSKCEHLVEKWPIRRPSYTESLKDGITSRPGVYLSQNLRISSCVVHLTCI